MPAFVTSRRAWLRHMLASTATIGAMIPLLRSWSAEAASLSTQAAANYVTHPGPGGAKCGSCQFFVSNSSDATAAGSCTAVAGSISPNGYCPYFTAKS